MDSHSFDMRHTVNIVIAVIGALGYVVAAIIQSRASRDRADLEREVRTLQKQIAVMRSAAAAAPTTSTTADAAAPAVTSTNQHVTQNNISAKAGKIGRFNVRLTGCSRAGGAVECAFTIENPTGAERTCVLWTTNGYAQDIPLLIDNRDNSYAAVDSRLGIMRHRDGWANIETTIPPGLNVRASLTFANVDRGATSIRLLRLPISESGEDWGLLDFANVELTE